jgi:NAD(P)-dependent dehydrogenase (short-subunit alcohol dehydrogenase family)
MRTQGAAALVTGGASGLGEATVRRLAEAGAVCTILDRNAEKGKALAAELGGANFVEADVTDSEEVAAAVAAAGEAGPLRICVNCAGLGIAMRTIARDGTPHDLDAFRFVLNVNLIGTFNVLRLAASAMSRNESLEDGERGVIVNTASVAAFDGQIGQIAYSASKGGIVSMTLTAARDLAPSGIRVVTVAPGTFDTPLMGFASQETKEGLAANIPFPRRMGDPREFAALVAHVVENTYLNGETIRLDGAIRMPPK